MKNVWEFAEIAFWSIWFAVPGLFSLMGDGSGPSAVYWISLLAFGLCLSGLGYALRARERARFRVNISVAVTFFILYFMIGYPNLLRANGERPMGPMILLIAISVVPLMFFVGLRLKRKHGTASQ